MGRKRVQWQEELSGKRSPKTLKKIQQGYSKVDKRAVRDRYNLLSKEQKKLKKLKKQTETRKEIGIETDIKEFEMALEELIDKEDAAETEQRVVDDQKKTKDSEDRKNA